MKSISSNCKWENFDVNDFFVETNEKLPPIRLKIALGDRLINEITGENEKNWTINKIHLEEIYGKQGKNSIAIRKWKSYFKKPFDNASAFKTTIF